MEKTNLDYGTLRNDKWIASRVPSERRKENLSFDHHATVADLPDEEQEELLSTAQEKHLNNETFRKFVKGRELAPKNGSLSRAHDNSEIVHQILNANDVLTRHLENCNTDSLANHEKLRLTTELTKTKEVIESFLVTLE